MVQHVDGTRPSGRHVDDALPMWEHDDGALPIVERVDGALPMWEHDDGTLPIVDHDVSALPNGLGQQGPGIMRGSHWLHAMGQQGRLNEAVIRNVGCGL